MKLHIGLRSTLMGSNANQRWVFCVPIDTHSPRALSDRLAVTSSQDVVAAALQIRANKWEAPFCVFKL